MDGDGDGFSETDDCADDDPDRHPEAQEVCDGIDNDCDGSVDEELTTTFYTDDDGDGFGAASSGEDACTAPDGAIAQGGDCDDTEDAIHPDAPELCDGIDNDCDDSVDESDAVDANTWYIDGDGDGYGDHAQTVTGCAPGDGHTADASDCDDTDPEISPGAHELCDDLDNDCDGSVDEDDAIDGTAWYLDRDGDGFGDQEVSTTSCSRPTGMIAEGGDCDDTGTFAVWTYPGAAPLDSPAECLKDLDGDDYGDSAPTNESVKAGTDCDDNSAAIYPTSPELCDWVDNDCDLDVDEDPVDGGWFWIDADSDGFGASGEPIWACDGATNALDCDDSVSGDTIAVDVATGSDTNPGSYTAPLLTIQAGIDAASSCVVVAAGTYYEAIDFSGKDLVVTGEDGSGSTTIDASGLGSPVATFMSGETSAAELSGFTLTGGEGYLESSTTSSNCYSNYTCYVYTDTYCGGGLYIDSSDPTLTDLSVEYNTLNAASTTTSGYDTWYTYSFGGGVCALNSAASLTGVDLIENQADQGGGAYVDTDSSVTFEQGWVIANSATDGAGVQVDGGTSSLTNVASLWNEASTDGGGILLVDGTVSAVNVTLAGDDASNGGGLYASGSSTASVWNSIIANAGTGVGVLVDAGSSYSGGYSNVYGNAGGDYSGTTDPTGTSGNISSDPAFTALSDDGDHTNDDVSLGFGSPSVDAGDPDLVYADADGTANDQGAFGGPLGAWN